MAIQSIVAIDVGSTTTKAILIDNSSGEFRLRWRAEAPTTVEKPMENVMLGVQDALQRLEKLAGRELLQDGRLLTGADSGIDQFVATSSAGGGLQMIVGGIWQSMTADSAKKAALGAGAIVMDIFAIDDERTPLEKMQRLQELRPDMILLSGGIDGGNTAHVGALAEVVALAKPAPRLGSSYVLPVVYAGNRQARRIVDSFLDEVCLVKHVDNLRPTLEKEVLQPAREQIHDLFMEHVMSQAPGYATLLEWCQKQILPTPGAVGRMVQAMGETQGINVVATDIGGATTDVFSSAFIRYRRFNPAEEGVQDVGRFEWVSERVFHRSVSANLGMSYSLGNVLLETGLENIVRWLPFSVDTDRLRDWCANKMMRPTTLPQTLWGLMVEQAFAREALRLALLRHLATATGLQGISVKRNVDEIFNQQPSGKPLFQKQDIDAFVGSGGVLAHAPRRAQTLSIMLDALQPEGVAQLYVDSIFMMPQLGMLATVDAAIAQEVFYHDCLHNLAACIAPVGRPRFGRKLATVRLHTAQGEEYWQIMSGELNAKSLPAGSHVDVEVQPVAGVDVGAGPGKALQTTIQPGEMGLILDGRHRPIEFPLDAAQRISRVQTWYDALQVYPSAKEAMQ